MTPNELDRRAFVKATGTAVGGMLLAQGCGSSERGWRFFTDAEATVVDAIAEQIIPADQDPGARDAGVVNYIDRQLIGPFTKHQEAYRHGLAGVQQASRAMFGGDFEALAWEQQTDVLRALQRDEAAGSAWETASARAFFELIRDHTMQGFYGSPRHGGNRGFASFTMLGIDYPRIVGQNRYRAFPGER